MSHKVWHAIDCKEYTAQERALLLHAHLGSCEVESRRRHQSYTSQEEPFGCWNIAFEGTIAKVTI